MFKSSSEGGEGREGKGAGEGEVRIDDDHGHYARKYQLDIFHQIKKENSLVILPTGSGKTYIAVLLIRHRLNQLNSVTSVSEKNKKLIFFLAPTKVLVEQQCKYIKLLCYVKVESYTGEGFVIDMWKEPEWEYQRHHVDIMVMTPAIFQRILDHNFLPFESFDTIIIDECHHCTGKSSVCMVFDGVKNKMRVHQHQPLLFGMTASAIQSKKEDLNAACRRLKDLTNCKIIVPKFKIDGVSEYVNLPKCLILPYSEKNLAVDCEILLSDYYENLRKVGKSSVSKGSVVILARSLLRCQHALIISVISNSLQNLHAPLSFSKLTELQSVQSFPGSNKFKTSLKVVYQVVNQVGRILKNCGAFAALYAFAHELPTLIPNNPSSSIFSDIDLKSLFQDLSPTNPSPSGTIDFPKMEEDSRKVYQGPYGKSITLLCQGDNIAKCCLVELYLIVCHSLGELIVKKGVEQVNQKYLNVCNLNTCTTLSDFQSNFERYFNLCCDNSIMLLCLLKVLLLETFSSGLEFSLDAKGVLNLFPASLTINFNQVKIAIKKIISCIIQRITGEIVLNSVLSGGKLSYRDLDDVNGIDFNDDNERSRLSYYQITTKTQLLFQELLSRNKVVLEYLNNNNSQLICSHRAEFEDGWCAIVFCKMRLACVALEALCQVVVDGFTSVEVKRHVNVTMRSQYLHGELHEKLQNEAVSGFRRGDFRILFATDVAEEGLDIRSCQLVINFDCPATVKSFIQRRGRARAKESFMITLLQCSSSSKHDVESIQQFLKSELTGSNPPFETESLTVDVRIDDQIYEIKETGAIVRQSASISLLQRYCESLSGQGSYYQPRALFSIEEVSESYLGREIKKYRCSVLLPQQVPVDGRFIVGDLYSKKSFAKASAAYHAVVKLYELGEINGYLNPVHNSLKLADDDISNNDDESGFEVQIKVVPDIVKSIQTQNFEHLYLYSFDIQHVTDSHILSSCQKCSWYLDSLNNCGIAYIRQLPKELLSEIITYNVSGHTIAIRLHFLGKFEISQDIMIQLQRFHKAVIGRKFCSAHDKFEEITSWCRVDKAACYLCCPLNVDLVSVLKRSTGVLPHEYLDFLRNSAHEANQLMNEFASENILKCDMKSKEDVDGKRRRLDRGSLHNQLLEYNDGLYKCFFDTQPKCIDDEMPANSSNGVRTLSEHYLKKEIITEDMLRLLRSEGEVVMASVFAVSKKVLSVPILQKVGGDEGKDRHNHNHGQTLYLLPKLCRVIGNDKYFPIGLIFPSVAWMIHSHFLCSELKEMICNRMSVSSASANRKYLTPLSDNLVNDQSSFSMPLISQFIEAMTPVMSVESIDYERLEYLGDTVLKFVVSVDLFYRYPSKHEGHLTTERSAIISNRNLRISCQRAGIDKYIRSVQFAIGTTGYQLVPPGVEPSTWQLLASGRQVQEMDAGFAKMNINPKIVSDCVESLIGIFYLSGGFPIAIEFMKSLGLLDLQPPQIVNNVDCTEHEVSIPFGFSDDLRQIAQSVCLLSHYPKRVEVLTEFSSSILCYSFRKLELLDQALTHCSVIGKSSNQRLEFVGDAILDFIVVEKLYQQHDPLLTPGYMTKYKNEATCNNRLSFVAARLQLYRYMNYMTPGLDEQFCDLAEWFSSLKKSQVAAEESGSQYSLDTDNMKLFRKERPDDSVCKCLADAVEAIIGAIYVDSDGDLAAVRLTVKALGLLPPSFNPEASLSILSS